MQAATRKEFVRYKYDALGRRVQRTLGSGKDTTKFIYDGLSVLLDESSGGTTKYLNGYGVDNKLKIKNNATAKYFLHDHLKSTIALADSTGAIVEQTGYDSFGNASSSLSTRYQFTGREHDNLTGLDYYRRRWYDAALGRFISEDPIGFDGGDPNLFSYVRNNPLNFLDPSGLVPFKLPANPGQNGSNLPQGWKQLTEHSDPTNPGTERWVSPNGDEGLEFHPGRPGGGGDQENDHWHELKPRPGRPGKYAKQDEHLKPGEEIELNDSFCPLNDRWSVPNLGFPVNYPPGLPQQAAVGVGAVVVVVVVVIILLPVGA